MYLSPEVDHMIFNSAKLIDGNNRRVKWIVRWMDEKIEHSEGFEFLTIAQFRMIELEDKGIKPIISQV